MAYYLQFDGIDDFLAFDADISFNIGVDAYAFEFTANIKSFPSTLTAGIVGTGTSSTGGIVMRAASPVNSLALVSSNASRYDSGADFIILNEIHTYRLEHDSAASGGQYRWYRDDVLFSSGNYTSNINLALKVFGKTKSDGLWSNMDVYSFEFISGFSTNPAYPAVSFTGIGNRLIDAGGINGATINGAQWVFYDDGGLTNYDLDPEPGFFSYLGGNVPLLINRELSPQSAVYSYAGSEVGLLLARSITAEHGQFSYAGGNVTLILNRVIQPDVGLFSYVGGNVDIQYAADSSISITPEAGIFSYSGGAVDFLINRVINPQTGNYECQGGSVDINTGKSLTPETGQFNYFGADVGITIGRVINPLTGLYSYTGGAVPITYSGLVVRRITNYSVSFEQDYVAGQYASDFVSGFYENDYVSGFYEDIE